MTIAIIVACCIGLTWIASTTSYWILKVFAGLFWWGLGFYWVANPVAGSLQTILVMLCIGIGLACFFWSFWYTSKRIDNGVEKSSSRFKLPFINNEEEEYRPPELSRNDRLNDYARRVNNAMNGRRTRRG